MQLSDLDYYLPQHLIAQHPLSNRDDSKLMVVNRKNAKVTHTQFKHLLDFLDPSYDLIRNNVSVLKARLYGTKETGGKVEIFLLKPDIDGKRWWCLIRSNKVLKDNCKISINDQLSAILISKKETGECLIEWNTSSPQALMELIENEGHVPLPPYIKETANTQSSQGYERYQTLYARPDKKHAVASPTAGLHFSDKLLGAIKQSGMTQYDLTLHIGLGTFKPITTDNVLDHTIHQESYEIPPATQQALFNSNKKCVVGTTTTRSIEHFLNKHANPLSFNVVDNADIFIYPPYTFKGIDALITNFHLPKTTLMCLVGAFLDEGSRGGIEWLKSLYKEACEKNYRFYSYGDAMLIL